MGTTIPVKGRRPCPGEAGGKWVVQVGMGLRSQRLDQARRVAAKFSQSGFRRVQFASQWGCRCRHGREVEK